MSWRDPATWREDPAIAAQAAVAEVTSTAQATVADVTSTAQSVIAEFQARTAERPETRVGVAFAGGILSALILRRLAS
ncbi:MAG: hypothetical protein M3071_00135 [Actinomycetota bacterium]|nr:hypothetical protein [Actinomycetota bacterium]